MTYYQLPVKTVSQTCLYSSQEEGGHGLGSVCPHSGPKEVYIMATLIPFVGAQSHAQSWQGSLGNVV